MALLKLTEEELEHLHRNWATLLDIAGEVMRNCEVCCAIDAKISEALSGSSGSDVGG